jgi:hypothetical protein
LANDPLLPKQGLLQQLRIRFHAHQCAPEFQQLGPPCVLHRERSLAPLALPTALDRVYTGVAATVVPFKLTQRVENRFMRGDATGSRYCTVINISVSYPGLILCHCQEIAFKEKYIELSRAASCGCPVVG